MVTLPSNLVPKHTGIISITDCVGFCTSACTDTSTVGSVYKNGCMHSGFRAPQQLLQHSPAHGVAGGSAWSCISKQYFRRVFGTVFQLWDSLTPSQPPPNRPQKPRKVSEQPGKLPFGIRSLPQVLAPARCSDCSPGCGHCPAAVSHPRCQSSPLLHPAVLPGHHRQLSICPLHTTQPATPSQSGFSSKRLEKSTAVSKLSATYLCAPTFDFRHVASCFQNHSAQHARTHSFLWALKV